MGQFHEGDRVQVKTARRQVAVLKVAGGVGIMPGLKQATSLSE
jgi:hypothetical protein